MNDAGSTSNTPDIDLSGRQLGDYRLLRRLGEGAMAEVYLAEQLSLRRNVAFKVLRRQLADNPSYVRRFHMEARAAAALVHANIVQIYEVGEVDGLQFIALEYVPGNNLAQSLAQSGPLHLAAALAVMRQVATALAKAAEQGIVHRDIKPENLLLSPDGEIKVADFGLAHIVQSPEQLKLTTVGMTMGSPLYMSPEQVEGKPLDPRTDMYSFGVTCYQMLAGRTPFEGDSALTVAVQHMQTAPLRLENVRPDLPPGLCRIVHKMLSKDPQDRYANGAEVLGELRKLNIDELPEAWPHDVEQFSTAEAVALAGEARSSATQKLAAVMAQQQSPQPNDRTTIFWAVVSAAFLLGVMLAWPRPEASLLDGAMDPPQRLPQMASAAEQYQYAMMIGTEPGWQSVLEYYSHDEYHVHLARKQLAELYLTRDLFDAAMPLFEQFTRLGDAEQDFVAYGLAGQYVVLSLTGEPDLAAQKFGQFWPLRKRLAAFDPQMTRRALSLAIKNRQIADREEQREINDWLQRHTDDPQAPDTGD